MGEGVPRVELFEVIRRDSRLEALSIRQLAVKQKGGGTGVAGHGALRGDRT